MSGEAVVRVQPLGGSWQTLGADRYRGVVPEGTEAKANDWGPDTMSFRLKVEPGAQRPDLLPFTPVELEVDGMLVWAGRVRERPAGEREHVVQCQGWQYHLDDDLLDRVWVHTRMSDWKDLRGALDTNLAVFTTGYEVRTDDGQMHLSVPNGNTVIGGGASAASAYLDLGPSSVARRVVITYKGGGHANFALYLSASSTSPSGLDDNSAIDAAPIATTDTTVAFTLSADRRYVRLNLVNLGAGITVSDDTAWVRISAVKVFRDTAYESGNVSVLKADTVVKDARAIATLLNQTNALISAGTFDIPEYGTDGYQSPRQIIEAVNAYENYQAKIGGHDLKTLVYRAKPSSPLFEVGEWSGSDFSDASISGDEIVSTAVVDASGPDGTRFVVARSHSGTLVGKRGFVRARVLPIRSAITQAVAERFGDLWLTEHKTAPFSGKLTVSGKGARRLIGGASVAPHELLLHAGEKIRLSHRVDPDTGAWGRDGRIAGATYRHDQRTVEIDIDDRRSSFEQVLSRYGVLTDQIR